MALFEVNEENQRIELRLDSNPSNETEQLEHAIDLAHDAIDRAWEPRSCGRCGKNLWQFYFLGCCSCICPCIDNDQDPPNCCQICFGGACCGSEDDDDDGYDDPFCWDCEHVTMHLFFISLIAVGILLIQGNISIFTNDTNQDDDDELKEWFLQFIGSGVFCVGVFIFAFIVFNIVLSARMEAAELLDVVSQLDEETKKFHISVIATGHLRDRLMEADNQRADTVNELRKKLRDLKLRADEGLLVSEESRSISKLLVPKFEEIEKDLEDALFESQKGIVEAIYESMQFKDKEKGLNKQEFERFVRKLDGLYREKFKLHIQEFDQLSGDDGIFDRKDLFDLLDEVSRERALMIDEDE